MENLMANTHKSLGYYFEDFYEGFTIESAGRTVTEADIVNFSGVAGDFNQISGCGVVKIDLGGRIVPCGGSCIGSVITVQDINAQPVLNK